MRTNRLPAVALTLAVAVSSSSCAVLRAGSYASEAFMREGDPRLAAEALPTMIKASEALLLADPKDEAKALTTASLYVMYANAFLDGEAFLLPDDQYERRLELSTRAKALYGRATALLAPVIEKRSPGAFEADYRDGAAESRLSRFGRKDVPLLYWTTAAILASFASDPMDFDNASRVAAALALFERARALDPDWNGGGLHELAITVYGSLPADLGGDKAKARAAFEAALEAAGSATPGPYVAYAASVCVASGDREAFEAALEKAVGLPGSPESALMSALSRRKARRLLDDISLYF